LPVGDGYKFGEGGEPFLSKPFFDGQNGRSYNLDMLNWNS